MWRLRLRKHPKIKTSRLLLREVTYTDINEVFRLRTDPHVMRFILRPRAKNRNDARNFIARNREGWEAKVMVTWVIQIPGKQGIIGHVGLWRIEPENYRAEIGYALLPEFEGYGYMREAIHAVLDFAFQKLGLHSIEARIGPRNGKSRNVLAKAGFKKEGHLRQNFYFEGKFRDAEIYSKIRATRSSRSR
jgi:ribosomal-protein-alanine N-acetyltransferase